MKVDVIVSGGTKGSSKSGRRGKGRTGNIIENVHKEQSPMYSDYVPCKEF